MRKKVDREGLWVQEVQVPTQPHDWQDGIVRELGPIRSDVDAIIMVCQ